MTLILEKYFNTYIPIKYFLNSYRALSDGKSGVTYLKDGLESDFQLWNWKTIWIGSCTIIRTSITLMQHDIKSCINMEIRKEIKNEWDFIRDKKNYETNKIYWDFLLRERDSIIHYYRWSAYEVWIDENGNFEAPKFSLLSLKPKEKKSVLIMKDGPYQGRDSLELLNESASWAEERLLLAIRRAGFNPEEKRNARSFEKQPPRGEKKSSLDSGLLGSTDES